MATATKRDVTDLIHDAKLYTSALYAVSVADEKVSDAERWRIGDDFIAKHKDDEDNKVKPNSAFLTPSRESPFWATSQTQPGDAEKTYERLMTKRFGPRPSSN
ncbi:MAG: hypothetical protein ACRDMH_13250 [Solirubrobacterales bacterium]